MSTTDDLRAWARGSHPRTAGVELLVRAFEGRFACRDQPWIVTEPDGHTWVDADRLQAHLGVLSGGERRVLSVVVALIADGRRHLIDPADVATGIDRTNLDLVLAAIAHTAGSHEHAELVSDRAGTRLARLGSLHDWPLDASSQVQPFGRL